MAMGPSRHVLVVPSEAYLPDQGSLQGIFQHHQAHALSEHGFVVGIVSPILNSVRNPGRNWFRLGTEHSDEGRVRVIRSFGWHPPCVGERRASLHWVNCGLRLYKEYSDSYGVPAVVHAHNCLPAGILAMTIHERFGIPFVVTEHSSVFMRRRLSKSDIRTVDRIVRSSAAVLTVSPALGGAMVSALPDTRIVWESVPNVLPPLFEAAELAERRTTDGGSFLFFHAASLDQNKDQENLLRAFRLLSDHNLDVRLRIAGDGPLRSVLQSLARDLQIDDRVAFLGRIDHQDMLCEMSNCDAFVLCSRVETFGVVLIEALSRGKPVVATACGGAESIVSPGDGYIVPAQNPLFLSRAMARLLDDYHSFDPLDLRNRCLDRFGSHRLAETLANVYSSALEGNPSHGIEDS